MAPQMAKYAKRDGGVVSIFRARAFMQIPLTIL